VGGAYSAWIGVPEMKHQVWKFPVEIGGASAIDVEPLAKFLSFALDGQGTPCAYYLVDPTCETKARRLLRVVGTGWDIEIADGLKHLGTITRGEFVWHLFGSEHWL
jgi:hypothetical protein